MEVCRLTAAIAAAVVSRAGFAQTTVFESRSDFRLHAAALGVSLQSESFESAPIGAEDPVLEDFRALGDGRGVVDVREFGAFGAYPTEGDRWLAAASDGGEAITLSLLFDEPIHALGFDVTDIGDFGQGSLTLVTDAGDVETVFTTPGSNGNEVFFGIVSAGHAFGRVDLLLTIEGEAYGMDWLEYGVLPAPATLLALAPVAFFGRQRGSAALG
ncbi:MAG: hypothetical protein H6811_07500 [Phycisphaeraceae bacterium]|nr:hypothetical protein [Phycisphaeraceae bacterium]